MSCVVQEYRDGGAGGETVVAYVSGKAGWYKYDL